MPPTARSRALPRASRKNSLDAGARLDLLFEASERLSLANDERAILDELVSLLVPRLADGGVVGLADASGTLRIVETANRCPGWTMPLANTEAGGGLLRAYETGASSIVHPPRLSEVAPWACDATRSALFVPLKFGSRILGAVALFECRPDRTYDAEDAKLVEKLANRAALAIERARLFAAERRAAERLASLQRLTSKLSHALTLEDVGSVIVHEASKTLLSCPILVYVVKASGELLDLLARPGDHPAPSWLSLLSDEAHPLRDAIRTGEPVWIASREDLAARYPHSGSLEGFEKAFVCLPLVIDRRAIGALVLGFHHDPMIDPTERSFVQAVGLQCAQALDRARLYSEAEGAIRVRDDFLAVASHELNTPLTSLKLALGHLRRGNSRDPETLARLLGVIDRQADRLGALVGDLLDVSRLTSGSVDLELAEVDIVEVVRGTLERHAVSFEKSRSAVTFTAPTSLVGRWDRKRIEQVTCSLVSNAIKFGCGKPIEVVIEHVDGDARLTVRDGGVGIPEEQQLRIFDRYERAVGTPHYGGFGIGLWLSRRVLEAVGGSIEVESLPGCGATFTVHLPLDVSNDRSAEGF